PGRATVELVVRDWMRELLGMPEGSEGVLARGGSLANTTALAAARLADGEGVAYLSDQTHSSIGRGLLAMGFAPSMVRVIATGDDLRLTAELVAAAASADRAAGRRPGFVIATAGTTNTGAVDDLPGLADLCAGQRMWFHVDGAYGAPAALCDHGRRVLSGIERARHAAGRSRRADASRRRALGGCDPCPARHCHVRTARRRPRPAHGACRPARSRGPCRGHHHAAAWQVGAAALHDQPAHHRG